MELHLVVVALASIVGGFLLAAGFAVVLIFPGNLIDWPHRHCPNCGKPLRDPNLIRRRHDGTLEELHPGHD